MKEYNVLLCCGAGMSSGFLAQQLRSAAKKKKIPMQAAAKSQNDIEDYLSNADVLLIGPHLAYLKEDLEKKCKPYNIPVEIIPKNVYAALNGAKLLDQVIAMLNMEDMNHE